MSSCCHTTISALQEYGVEEIDAYDYGLYGCNDPNLPMQEGSLRQLWFNMLRPLELALNNGDYPLSPNGSHTLPETQYSLDNRMIGLMTGPYYGAHTADIKDIHGIDELLEAYRLQVRFLLEDYRMAFERDFQLELKYNAGRIRIEDCFLHGTIDNATTWNNGGTKYHKITLQGSGMASVADSLAAVEQLVFRDKEMSLPELVEILRHNFEGHEILQARLSRKMPKYGNDIEWVDELARKVVDIYCDEIQRVNGPKYVYQFFPCISTDRDFTTMGKDVGATPDGRRAGQQVSENQSPTQGADMNGLTALLNSVARLPFQRITGGPLNVRMHPSAVKGENGLRMFATALKTYFEKGGMQIQINVMSREQLLDAQQNPHRYKNLCVRVTGYAAYFVQMGKKAQDELINRTEKS
jgi:formate C-acetyltransferase